MPENWREHHPAYPDLVEIFKGSTRDPEHLAFLVVHGLAARGWEIERASELVRLKLGDVPLAEG
jgi:hypothetical protein